MKTFLLTGLALLAVSAARADLFRPGFRDHGRRSGTVVSVGFGVPYRGYYGYDYGTSYCSTLSNYDTYRGTGSYAANGLWLGALTGAIVGHNSGDLRHNGWRGAALGAGVGLLLGSIADANRPAVNYVAAQPQPPAVAVAPVHYAQPAPAVVAASATPLSGANALFGR